MSAAEDTPTVQVHVDAEGMVRAVCSCGDHDEHGTDRRVLQRTAAHVQLHATAASRGVPWAEVRRRRALMDLGPGRN